MNKYNVTCPGCGAVYVDVIIRAFSKLLHPGVNPSDASPKLPTPNCVAMFDYVSFKECHHCCPETFGQCPDCDPPHIGYPTKDPCRA
jgi:hypothetical protein